MADVAASMGRMLLGANQAGHKDTAAGVVYRSWEAALFQVGMVVLAVGYTTCFCEFSPTGSTHLPRHQLLRGLLSGPSREPGTLVVRVPALGPIQMLRTRMPLY